MCRLNSLGQRCLTYQTIEGGYSKTAPPGAHRRDVVPGVGHRVETLAGGEIIGSVVPEILESLESRLRRCKCKL